MYTMSNCAKCGKVFSKTTSPICDDCIKVEENMFEKVRMFLDEYPNSTLEEVAIATEVSPKKILGYLKSGRLETSTGMRGDLKCSQCGRPISRGRFCDKCVININTNVNEMFAAKKKGPMVYTHSDRKK